MYRVRTSMNTHFLQIYTQTKIPRISHASTLYKHARVKVHDIRLQARVTCRQEYTQIIRITRKYAHVSVMVPNGIFVASITAIIGLSTRYHLSHVLLANLLFQKRSRHHEFGY